MKKNVIWIALSMVSAGAMAQETYESAQLATQDLNGTARYVGMGGAMEALGADISTINTNPAGIGLFRRAWIGASGGVTIQNDDKNKTTMLGKGDNRKANADLNQVGFIYASRFGANSYFNIGFNYQKSRNFNQIASAVGSLSDASANKLTYITMGTLSPNSEKWIAGEDTRFEYISRLGRDTYNLVNENFSGFNENNEWQDGYTAADMYNAYSYKSGYISDFAFNFSGNFNERVYIGATFGLKDVHYNSYTMYKESLVDANSAPRGNYYYTDNRNITGTGFDLKFGLIVRPSEESPFRIGAYIHTPTWYELTCKSVMTTGANYTYDNNTASYSGSKVYSFNYDYKIITPWRFGFSVGHTFGKIAALGATYEYSDYSTIKNRIYEGTIYNYWGDSSSKYSPDVDMDENTKNSLKGVHLIKIGGEIKPSQVIAIRAGYNYQSAIYNNNGMKDAFIDSYYSEGAYFSTYGYTNWNATHRITLGMGFTLSKDWTFDISYQYATQNGEYHPFQNVGTSEMYTYNDDGTKASTYWDSLHADSKTIKNKRHQINCSLSYRF